MVVIMTADSRKSSPGFTLIELMIIMVIIGILLSIIMPAIRTALDEANVSKCASNLHQIGVASWAYYKNHDAFPVSIPDYDDWGLLLYNGGYVDNENVFDCPSVPGVGTAAATDYWPNGWASLDDPGTTPSNTILCGCRNGAHNGRENVLYADGHVELQPQN